MTPETRYLPVTTYPYLQQPSLHPVYFFLAQGLLDPTTCWWAFWMDVLSQVFIRSCPSSTHFLIINKFCCRPHSLCALATTLYLSAGTQYSFFAFVEQRSRCTYHQHSTCGLCIGNNIYQTLRMTDISWVNLNSDHSTTWDAHLLNDILPPTLYLFMRLCLMLPFDCYRIILDYITQNCQTCFWCFNDCRFGCRLCTCWVAIFFQRLIWNWFIFLHLE